MKVKLTYYILVSCVAIFSFGCSREKQPADQQAPSPAKTTVGKMGTGEQGGVFYTVGLALADLVNRGSAESHIRLSVEPTSGSVFNINGIVIQALEFGLSDEEREFQAVRGQDYWQGMPQQRLRFICSLYPELLTVVVLDSSEINSLADLKGKRVAIGPPGSGTQSTALDVLASVGLKSGDNFEAVVANSTDAPQMLLKGQVDAFFYLVGHPNGPTMEVTSGGQKVRFLPIEPTAQLLRDHPYYDKGEIPVHLYPGVANESNVPSIGMQTALLTSSQVSNDVVYTVTKALFENLEWFRQQQPVLADLNSKQMVQGGIAPMAAGAQRYYQEAGLLGGQ